MVDPSALFQDVLGCPLYEVNDMNQPHSWPDVQCQSVKAYLDALWEHYLTLTPDASFTHFVCLKRERLVDSIVLPSCAELLSPVGSHQISNELWLEEKCTVLSLSGRENEAGYPDTYSNVLFYWRLSPWDVRKRPITTIRRWTPVSRAVPSSVFFPNQALKTLLPSPV